MWQLMAIIKIVWSGFYAVDESMPSHSPSSSWSLPKRESEWERKRLRECDHKI